MKRAEILAEAEKCVCGKHEQEYGTPEDNFTTIGLLWSVYLRAAYPDLQKGLPINGINAKDVATMMALLKVARIATGSNQDSFVDLAGYAACAGEVATQMLKQNATPKNETFCVVCGESIPEGRQYCREHDFNNSVPKMKSRGQV